MRLFIIEDKGAVGGLCLFVFHVLTSASVHRESFRTFRELSEIFSDDNNYSLSRELLVKVGHSFKHTCCSLLKLQTVIFPCGGSTTSKIIITNHIV